MNFYIKKNKYLMITQYLIAKQATYVQAFLKRIPAIKEINMSSSL